MVWKYKVRISRDMYSYFNPEVYIFRIFGIFPFTTVTSSSGLFFKWSFWYTLYSCFLALFLIIVSFTEAFVGMFFKEGGVKLDIINNTDNFVWLFTVTVYCLATFIVTFVTPKKFREICDYIKCIDKVDEIESVKSKIDFDFPSIILLLDSIVVTTSICFTYFLQDDVPHAMFSVMVRVVPFACHILIGDMVQYMIRIMMRILIMKFVYLNKSLNDQYQKIKNCNVHKRSLKAYSNIDGRTIPDGNNNMFVLSSSLPISLNLITTDVPENKKIMALSKAYLKLMEAAKILNNHFGMIILIVMASSLFQLISTPYHIILSLEGKRRGIAETLRRLIKFSEQLIRILILIEPMYECSLKMQQTGREVCNLLALNIEPQYRKQVDGLAMCICLKQMKFSAWGCFDIDRFLLSTLIGTITTYVCILLQAQENETLPIV